MAQAEQSSEATGAEIGSRYGTRRRTRYPPTWCSRFNVCSVNPCPLDPGIDGLTSLPGDPEPECPVSKPDRERFVSRMPEEMQATLPYGGLYRAEFNRRAAALARYSRLSEAERARIVSNLTPGARPATTRTTEAETRA